VKWLILPPLAVLLLAAGALGGFRSGSATGAPHAGGTLALTADQATFAATLSALMGYDENVIRAWVASEGNVGNEGQPEGNLLFLSCGVPEETGCVELAGRMWATFASPEDGAAAAYGNLARQPRSFGEVLAAGGLAPVDEMMALAESPWDEGHYGDPPGTNLIGAYDALMGIKVSCPRSRMCAE
jgi:hypothetical protein